MQCPYCRKENKNVISYCIHCGANIVKVKPSLRTHHKESKTYIHEVRKINFNDKSPLTFDHWKYMCFSPSGRLNRRRCFFVEIMVILLIILLYLIKLAAFSYTDQEIDNMDLYNLLFAAIIILFSFVSSLILLAVISTVRFKI